MIDETPPFTSAGTTQAADSKDPVLAYCQQCGRGLTVSSQRRIGAGIFCEPCAAVRTAQATGWRPVHPGTANAYPAGGSKAGGTPVTEEPNPMLAGFLGLIPGVGAMFNGQYAKGVIHLIIFVVLVSLADNLNWVLWWFVWGWVFYQGFEAYHTAQARRDGQPLPDPFGWNELGERLGFARSWPPAGPVPAQVPVPPPSSVADYGSQTVPPSSFQQADSDPYTAPITGFTPVSAASLNPQASFSQIPPPAPAHAGPAAPPYAPAYTGGGGPSLGQAAAIMESRRLPVGAAWLIGLGILFLLGNLLPTWHIDGRWLVPILLAAIAFWTGGSRLVALRDTRAALTNRALPVNVAGMLVWPCLLLTVATLLALQDASVVSMRHSWPVLLIVWGGLLLLQRAEDAHKQNAVSNAPTPITPGFTDSGPAETLR